METVEVWEEYNSEGVMIKRTVNGEEVEIPDWMKDRPVICIMEQPKGKPEWVKIRTEYPLEEFKLITK